MGLSSFHPIVSQWFSETLGAPTVAQEKGWAAIRARRHALIAAPTGSGKTLAAFLTALDDLVQEGLRTTLPDEVRVVYVSPLKALSADIHKNLAEPRRGIVRLAEAAGIAPPRITAAVRTGDTTSSERAAMLRTPPHILVTTPESLYLLLTAERSREMLRTARTIIVDEIHAVIGTRRGAHLAVSLERLQQVAEQPLLRIGLSATQKPIEEVARFLVGIRPSTRSGPAASEIRIVDEGHRRAMDLDLELPGSPLEAVMSHEVWEEYYNRLTALIGQHRTTLIFVNTRRLAERVARHLSDRLGDEAVTAHHGSLSKDRRLDAESRLKSGQLKALVATASLELGIDIGSVDLVCQIGSPHRIATFLQRVGRSGHTIAGTPKGRLFPISRDDLFEGAALLRSVRRGELDRIVSHDAPLDVLAQQIAAEAACCQYGEDELYELVRRAWPYRDLSRQHFDAVVAMAADGFATKRGRRAALIHRDEVNRRVRGRRATRMLAIASGGAIPEVADYRVIADPDDTFVGTLNEDFAIESSAGDVFQLGNTSWRVLQVGAGVVRVADAKGAPPTIPFWFGEAPARSDELSRAVSDLRADVEARFEEVRLKPDTTYAPVEAGTPYASVETGTTSASVETATTYASVETATTHHIAETENPSLPAVVSGFSRTVPVVVSGFSRTVIDWLAAETGIPLAAAEQIVGYLAESRRVLGVLPTQDTLVLERFFDESGGMQLVLHAPFGSRINKAWGLALRKRFCRQFNFELQAAATEDALMLSLGPQHSFPLADVFRYLHPATARDVLVQAFLDAPVFQTRWRWNTTVALAVPRSRHGRKVPAPLQRMLADDLMAAVFPDAAACLENIPGDRVIPDHPLVSQTVRDCLEEAMDFNSLAALLERIHRGDVRCVARDTPEPSPLAHEILNARPYAFLDDAPLEERRAQAVQTRRATEPGAAGDLGALDEDAIARVREEAAPDPRDADELHDALLTVGFLTFEEAAAVPPLWCEQLTATGRAALCNEVWVAAERLPEMLAVHPGATIAPAIAIPPSRAERAWTRDDAIRELLRGRLTILGPTTAKSLAGSLSIDESDVDTALLALESEGVVLRGHFEAPTAENAQNAEKIVFSAVSAVNSGAGIQWCDRRLLARIHRYTLNRLRAEIEPVSPADFMRFLFAWQHVDAEHRLTGIDGLRSVLEQLDGFELAADGWERAVLPARVDGYDTSMIDTLCLTGEVGWARLSAPMIEASQVVPATPVALFLRAHAEAWAALKGCATSTPQRDLKVAQPSSRAPRSGEPGPSPAAETSADPTDSARAFSETAQRVLEHLRARGASFEHELAGASGNDGRAVHAALRDLVAAGLVASDGFGGLRSIIRSSTGRPGAAGRRSSIAGRWSLLRDAEAGSDIQSAIELQARTLLKRYGVVFRRLLAREANVAPWRDLARVYRRLEARGEIRGGRFVAGMSGEQFALGDAVERLREIRRTPAHGRCLALGAADPLNLAGIVTAGERVRAVASNRLVYRDGVPIAVLEGEYVRSLAAVDPAVATDAARALTGNPALSVVSGFVGR